jgi:dihydrodipicolinate synthase/N-acetylneuraminate lyase
MSGNKEVADASPMPLFTYSLPGFSLDFFKRILELPQFVGIKNDAGNYAPHTDLLRIIREHGATFSSMSGGSMKPYMLSHPFGARAFADIRIAGIAPHLVIEFSRLMDERKYQEAVKVIWEYEEPLREKFETLSFTHPYRTCLKIAGHFKSDYDRNTKTSISEDEKMIVRKALEAVGLL